MDQPELDFLSELQAAEKECRRLGYPPSGFVGMLGRSGPFDAVRTLLNKPSTSDGFGRLWELGRLDLTAEAIALKPQWAKYFAPLELETARKRLEAVGYIASTAPAATPPPANGGEVPQLLTQLAAAKARDDFKAAKGIRGRLRQLGHYGASSTPPAPVSPPSPTITPPIPDAESLLARIRALPGLAERNHEDVVKDLLVRLGFDATKVIFQRGRIDVCVVGKDNNPVAVFEVKTSIGNPSQHADARRQGFDYANQTSARFVVLTDGDRYEIYDRKKGFDYSEALMGRFQLTTFRESDAAALDLIRPTALMA